MSAVVTWGAFEAAAPELARHARRLFDATGTGFLTTVPKDGAPRLHPVVPIFAGELLCVAVNARSPKRHDLLRDGRYALHAALGPDDEKIVLTDVALATDDARVRAAVVAAAAHTIHASDTLFDLRLSGCLNTRWERVGQPDARPARARWSVD